MIEMEMKPAQRPAASLLTGVLARAGDLLTLWCRNHRTRRQLSRLTTQQLADIGLNPEDRAQECQQWFWQK